MIVFNFTVMKRARSIVLFFICEFFLLTASAQKVTVDLKRSNESALSYWQIVDDSGNEKISAKDQNTDSITFSLPAEKQFSLVISSTDTIAVPVDYELSVNGSLIIKVKEASLKGEAVYKFFTGIHKEPSKIIGGSSVDISNFPWQVYFIAGNYRCGGIIISPGWVLTAAHCTCTSSGVDIPVADMSIVAGTNRPMTAGQGVTYKISEVIRHELYDPQTFLNDIALLRVSGDIGTSNASPIRLISSLDVSEGATLPGVMSWVTGWGVTSLSPYEIATTLMGVQLPIVSNTQAVEIWGKQIPATSMMAGYKKGNKDACSGDSGGPLVVPVLGEYKVAGIVSWGSTNCNTYSGFTRISYFLDWIGEKTGIIDFWPSTPTGKTVVCNSTDTLTYLVDPYPTGDYYNWQLYPLESGTITGNNTSAKVLWSPSYHGSAKVLARTFAANQFSNWSRLNVLVSPRINISNVPGKASICTNKGVTFKTVANGYNLSYKWYFNDNLLQSGTGNTYSINSLKASNSGIYRCEITDICDTVSSPEFTLDVLPITTITGVSPATYSLTGDSPLLEVSSIGDSLSYKWQKDGKTIEGTTGPTLRLFDVNASDIGQYRVTVSGMCGTVTSDSIYLYVKNGQASASDGIMVWPTVTSDYVNIAPGSDEPYTIRLYSPGGSLVKELTNCRYRTSVYAGSLPSGIYIIKISGINFAATFRVIKTQ